MILFKKENFNVLFFFRKRKFLFAIKIPVFFSIDFKPFFANSTLKKINFAKNCEKVNFFTKTFFAIFFGKLFLLKMLLSKKL